MTTRGPRRTHHSHGPDDAALPADLAAALAEIVPPGGAFRHREHIHLAYLAVQRHGADRAAWLLELSGQGPPRHGPRNSARDYRRI